MNKFFEVAQREFTRVLLLLALAALFIQFSTPFAELVNQPVFSAWGLFIGGCFVAVAVSHVCRRLLFPRLDLQAIANDAIRNKNSAAAFVFIGICLVLAAFVALTGSILRL